MVPADSNNYCNLYVLFQFTFYFCRFILSFAHNTWRILLDSIHHIEVSWPQRKPRLDPPDALLIPIPIAALCECITETIAAGHSNFEATVYRVGWWSGFGSVHTVLPPPQIYGPYVMNSNFFWLWTFSCNAIHRYRLIQDHETMSVQDNKKLFKIQRKRMVCFARTPI